MSSGAFSDEFSSIGILDSEKSHSTAQFRSIERMRDSLMRFEREHTHLAGDTVQGLENIQRKLNISATARGGLRNSFSRLSDLGQTSDRRS